MAEDLQLTGKAQRTVHAYLRAVRLLVDHCRKSPDPISETEMRRYFPHLKNNHTAANGTQRVGLPDIKVIEVQALNFEVRLSASETEGVETGGVETGMPTRETQVPARGPSGTCS